MFEQFYSLNFYSPLNFLFQEILNKELVFMAKIYAQFQIMLGLIDKNFTPQIKYSINFQFYLR
ncbi:hypothetical protein pb186bvf_014586 [Paramecium bursaria]